MTEQDGKAMSQEEFLARMRHEVSLHMRALEAVVVVHLTGDLLDCCSQEIDEEELEGHFHYIRHTLYNATQAALTNLYENALEREIDLLPTFDEMQHEMVERLLVAGDTTMVEAFSGIGLDSEEVPAV